MAFLIFAPILALLAPAVLAQYNYPNRAASSSASAAATTTSSGSSTVQTIHVGENGGFSFNPDSVTVPVGHTVEFHFFPLNHSVTQASFNNPCHPMSDTSFFSGFMPTSSGEAPKVFTITVNNTDPLWFYCAQTIFSHCQSGMVGVINPPSSGSQSLTAFRAAAKSADTSTNPVKVQGGIIGAASSSSASTSGTATSTGSSTGSAASASSTTGEGSALFCLRDLVWGAGLAGGVALLMM